MSSTLSEGPFKSDEEEVSTPSACSSSSSIETQKSNAETNVEIKSFLAGFKGLAERYQIIGKIGEGEYAESIDVDFDLRYEKKAHSARFIERLTWSMTNMLITGTTTPSMHQSGIHLR